MFRNLKISKKLLLGFGLVVVTAAIMLGIAISAMVSIGGMEHKLFTGPYISTTEAMGFRRDLNLLGKDIRSAALEKDVQKYQQGMDETYQSMKDRIAVLKTAFQGEQHIIAELENYLDLYADERDKVTDLMKNGKWDEAVDTIFSSYLAAFQKCSDQAIVLSDDAEKRGIEFDQGATNNVTTMTIILVILFVLMVVMSVIIMMITTRSITKPLIQVETAAKRISQGLLENDITYESKDEIGTLAESFRTTCDVLQSVIADITYLVTAFSSGNFDVRSRCSGSYVGAFEPVLLSLRSMVYNLSDTIKQINESSDQVSGGSDQVSSGAQALSQGATEQASSVEELAATINDISVQINSTAQNAGEANTKVTDVGAEAGESKRRMQEMLKAMSEISNSSSEIGKIIKTIEDIAFQTNILALNAAVEAARAGTAGKGFAVVADEVRNLASKSAEASKNTSALIEGSLRSVENGKTIADQTATSLNIVVEGVDNVAGTIHKISSATNEQAQSVAQVTQGIDQISSVVQTNSATAEESAAASEELSGQAQMLKDLVAKFILRDAGSGSGNSSYHTEAPVRHSSQEPVYEPLNLSSGSFGDGKY